MTARTWTDHARIYMQAAVEAENKYRDAKQLYADLTEAYRAQARAAGGNAVDIANAEHRAGSDERRKKAGGDAVFYCQEMIAMSNMANMCFLADLHNAQVQPRDLRIPHQAMPAH